MMTRFKWLLACGAMAFAASAWATDYLAINDAGGVKDFGSETQINKVTKNDRILVKQGTVNLNDGASVTCGGNGSDYCNYIGVDGSGAATLNVNGGSLWCRSAGTGLGYLKMSANNYNQTATLTINSGSVGVDAAIWTCTYWNSNNGSPGRGIINLNGGALNVTTLNVGADSDSSGSTEVYLAGGVLSANTISFRAYNKQIFRFEGGTLKARQANVFDTSKAYADTEGRTIEVVSGKTSVFDNDGYDQKLPSFTGAGVLCLRGAGVFSFAESTLSYGLELDGTTLNLGAVSAETPLLTVGGSLSIIGATRVNLTLPDDANGRYPVFANCGDASASDVASKLLASRGTFVLDNGTVYLDVGATAWVDDAYAYEIQYLESSGVQYIDTGIKPTAKTMFKATYQYVSSCTAGGGCDMIAGVRSQGDSATRYYPVSINASFPNERYVLAGHNNVIATRTTATRHDIVFNDSQRCVFVDGKFIGTFTATFANATRTLYLFAGNSEQTGKVGNADWYANARIYSCEIWEGSELKRHFIPVVDNDGVPCLFDKVTRTLFHNGREGVEPFTAGPRADAFWYETEYLRATGGTEYVDTGVYADKNVETRVGYRYNDLKQADSAMIGGSQSPQRYYPVSIVGVNTLKERYVWEGYQCEKSYPTLCHREVVFNNASHHVLVDGIDVYAETVKNMTQSTRPMLVFAASQTASPYHNWHAKASVWHYDILVDGIRERTFVPVVDMNGVACFYDRVTKKLFRNAGSGAFRSGRIISPVVTLDLSARTDLAANQKVFAWELAPAATTRFALDAATAGEWDVERRADGIYLVAKDASVPATAEWTGAAGDGDVTKAANWRCRDAEGEVLAAVTPAARTVIEVTGPTSIPLATLPDCLAVVFTGTVTLSADCDWSGLGTFVAPNGLIVDLAGHDLTLAGLATCAGACATFTDSSAADAGGTLCVVVNDELLMNENVALAGSLRFRKEGPGTFLAARPNQTYTGGTAVYGGVLRSCSAIGEYDKSFGFDTVRSETKIEVGPDGIFDVNGIYNGYFAYTLAGGTVMNGGVKVSENSRQVAPAAIELAADSCVSNNNFGLIGASYGPVTVRMNGHTLKTAFIAGSGNVFSIANATFEGEGKLAPESGWLKFHNTPSTGRNLTLEFQTTNGGLDMGAALTVSNYLQRANAIQGTAQMTVLGRYTVTKELPNNFPNMQLADGATLDLRELDGRGAFQMLGSGNRIVEFPANGRVTIDLGGRADATNGLQIVDWTGISVPEFEPVLDEETAHKFTIQWKPNGLCLAPYDEKSVATAVWTGEGDPTNAQDPANWSCFDSLGRKIDLEVIPTESTTLRLASETMFSIPTNQPITVKAISAEAPVELTCDRDWRGLHVSVVSDVTIRLNGHRLDLSDLKVASVIENVADEAQDETPTGELHVDIPNGNTVNTSLALRGNVKVVKEGAGTLGFEKANQTFTGGVEVKGGTISPKLGPAYWVFGGYPTANTSATAITLHEGAVLDINGYDGWGYTTVVMDGGTVRGSVTTNVGFNPRLRFTASSFIKTVGNNFTIPSYAVFDNLNGQTLAIDIANSMFLKFSQSSLTNGALNIRTGGWFENDAVLDARTVDFRVNCALKLQKDMSVRNWTMCTQNGNYALGSGSVSIYGTYTPESTYIYNFKMMDGSILNLADKTGAWSATGTGSAANKTLAFADGATVFVDLGTRTLRSREKIIDWTGHAPANLGTLEFKLASGLGGMLRAYEDGLYHVRGTTILIR